MAYLKRMQTSQSQTNKEIHFKDRCKAKLYNVRFECISSHTYVYSFPFSTRLYVFALSVEYIHIQRPQCVPYLSIPKIDGYSFCTLMGILRASLTFIKTKMGHKGKQLLYSGERSPKYNVVTYRQGLEQFPASFHSGSFLM